MKKRDIQIGKRYQCSMRGQMVTCKIIRKGWFRVFEQHEERWDFNESASEYYRHKFYWQIIEEF